MVSSRMQGKKPVVVGKKALFDRKYSHDAGSNNFPQQMVLHMANTFIKNGNIIIAPGTVVSNK
jgi:hypothetical protein